MKVSGKLLVILSIVAAVPVAIFAATSLTTYERELDRRVHELHARTADYGARTTTRELVTVQRTMRGLADTIPWQALDDTERQGALLLLHRQLADTAAVTLYDHRGTQLASTIGQAIDSHPTVTAAQVATMPPPASSSDDASVGAPWHPSGGGDPMLALALPVGGPDGMRWSVVVVYSLRAICAELVASAPAHVGVRLVAGSGELLCGAPAAGERVLTATAAGPHGWQVVAEQSRDVAFATLAWIRRVSAFWIAIALAAAIVAGVVLSRSIRKPLRELATAAEQLARGKLDQRVEPRGDDEFAALAHTFNRMSGEIQQWTQELEHRVSTRTAELKDAQEQLLQSRKLGAVAALGAGIAHEISNPLSGVLGMTQVLLARKDKLDERTVRSLGSVEREALRIRDIVERMSTLAQDATRDAVRVDLGEVIDSVAAAHASRLSSAGIALERSVSQDLPQVLGNPVQLEHALGQLVDNSIRAMPNGGRLDLRVRSVEGELVAVDVADTGKGIAPELIDKVFEPFYTTKDDWHGVGLGLSVAHQIVEAHRGRIRASSQVGVGTTMTLLFPAAARGAHLE